MSYLKIVLGVLLGYIAVVGWMVNSWLSLWMLMEISLMVFMGLLTFSSNYSSTELMMKYFVIQVLAGLLLAGCIIVQSFVDFLWMESGVCLMLMLKLGLAPFHFWIISLLGKVNWVSLVFMLSFLKLLPLIALSYLAELMWLGPALSVSVVVGSVMGINEAQLQKLLGYSSMVGSCWIVFAAGTGLEVFFFFWIGYTFMLGLVCYFFSLMSVYYLNQFKCVGFDLEVKICMFFMALSFAGIPPFFGFGLKWLVSYLLIYSGFKFLLILLVMFSLFSIVYYLQLWYYFMLVFSFEFKWYSFSLVGVLFGVGFYFVVFSLVLFYFWF